MPREPKARRKPEVYEREVEESYEREAPQDSAPQRRAKEQPKRRREASPHAEVEPRRQTRRSRADKPVEPAELRQDRKPPMRKSKPRGKGPDRRGRPETRDEPESPRRREGEDRKEQSRDPRRKGAAESTRRQGRQTKMDARVQEDRHHDRTRVTEPTTKSMRQRGHRSRSRPANASGVRSLCPPPEERGASGHRLRDLC